LLLSCVFARKFWFKLLQRVGLQFLAPQIGEGFFDDWWALGKNRFEGWVSLQKGLNSFVILGMWTCGFIVTSVFGGVSPSLTACW